MGKVINFSGGKTMGTNVYEVSDFFLSKESMTHKKLQKMCYYAYSWYLALYDKCLFNDGKFEAWVHGPVNPNLYQRYRDWGWRDIPKKSRKINLPLEITAFLDIIYNTFSGFSGDELESMTHQEAPWIEARRGFLPEQPSNQVISDNTIKSFYKNLMAQGQLE